MLPGVGLLPSSFLPDVRGAGLGLVGAGRPSPASAFRGGSFARGARADAAVGGEGARSLLLFPACIFRVSVSLIFSHRQLGSAPLGRETEPVRCPRRTPSPPLDEAPGRRVRGNLRARVGVALSDRESAHGRRGSGRPSCSRPCSPGFVTLLGSRALSESPSGHGRPLEKPTEHTFTKSERGEKAAA